MDFCSDKTKNIISPLNPNISASNKYTTRALQADVFSFNKKKSDTSFNDGDWLLQKIFAIPHTIILLNVLKRSVDSLWFAILHSSQTIKLHSRRSLTLSLFPEIFDGNFKR